MNNMILKAQMNGQQMAMVQSEFEKKKKSKTAMYLFWWFGAGFGAHRFYLGDTGRAFAILFLGWLTAFLWPLLDVFVIGKRLEEKNEAVELDLIQKVQAMSK